MKTIGEIVDLASAYYGSAVLFAAIDCDIFAKVEAGTLDVTSRGMRLLADACVAEGLLVKADGHYSNTAASKLALIPNAPADLTKAIRYNRDVYPAWGKLAEFARSSRPVERPELHLGEDANRTRVFADSMFSRAMGIGRGVVPMLKFPMGAKILDLAGGPAAYAILIAQANESAHVVSVDLAAISAVAKEYVAKFALTERVECRTGDYHNDEYEAAEYDAVTIFGALHQESPERIVDILKRANRALKKGGEVIVLDVMTDATHTAPKFSALFALNMALTTENGWVFADSELKQWMNEAGFEASETLPIPPPMPHVIVKGRKK